MNSNYVHNPTFCKFVEEKKTYYVPVDKFLNAADNILIDVRDPDSAGFGGSRFDIKTTEGADEVKGPWHGTVPYEVCNVTELHYTKVTLIANAQRIPFNERNSYRYKKSSEDSIEKRFHITGNVLYDEKEWVLGTFYRGDRIAQQLADLRRKTLWVHIETSGGSHSHECNPGDKLHPRAHRSGRFKSNDLSADQGLVVDA